MYINSMDRLPELKGADILIALSMLTQLSNITRSNVMIPTKDLINKKYGRLTIIKEVKSHIQPSGQKCRKVLCYCSCGNYKEIRLGDLKSGATQSCGCYKKEQVSKKSKKHGLIKHPLYRVWASAKDRCSNIQCKDYKDYGKRGIEVCDEWVNDSKVFIEWSLKNGWEKSLVIDRQNNDKGYSPNNCRFVDRGLSARNRRLLRSNNTSGYRGVYWDKNVKKWRARIMINKKNKHLGWFEHLQLAALRCDVEIFLLNDGRPLNFGN